MAKFIYRMQNILNIKLRLETQAKTEYAENAARLAAEEEKNCIIWRQEDNSMKMKPSRVQ